MTKNDGGPAFPTDGFKYSIEHGDHRTGMTMRDWFAGQCMRDTFAALAAAGWSNFNAYQLQRCAAGSYAAADAMLAARMTDAELTQQVQP